MERKKTLAILALNEYVSMHAPLGLHRVSGVAYALTWEQICAHATDMDQLGAKHF